MKLNPDVVVTGSTDYSSGTYIVAVILPAEVTSVPFSIPINDDNIFEDDKNFTLTIDPSSTPDGVSGGQATVTIVDDDRKSVAKR